MFQLLQAFLGGSGQNPHLDGIQNIFDAFFTITELLLFVPNFIGNSVGDSGLGVKISSLLALLPDNLMNLQRHLRSFSLYNWGTVLQGWPIILVLYGCLTVLLVPVIHRDSSRKQVK